jgi:type II secretory pathway pseudopilin PulG
VEILVVIAVIAILLTITVIGFNALSTGQKKSATRVLLEQMVSIQAEALSTKAASERFFQLDQWRLCRFPTPDAMDYYAPAPNFGTNPQSRDAFRQSQQVLAFFLQAPNAKKLYDGLSPEQVRTPEAGSLFDYSIFSPTGPKLPLDPWGQPLLYVPDGFIDNGPTDGQWPDGRTNSGNQAASTRGGLMRVFSEAAKTWYGPATEVPAGFSQAVDPRLPSAERNLIAVRSPDRRPFWFSAGPDGKYETHDDNIYSFEN